MKMLIAFLSIFFATLLTVPAQAQITGGGNSLFAAEYVYDFAVHGGATGFKSLKGKNHNALPNKAVITHAHYQVIGALTSGGSATVAIGDAASGARYLAATAFDNAAYTLNVPATISSGLPVYVSSANISNVGVTIAGAALTGGKIRVVLYGYIPKGN